MPLVPVGNEIPVVPQVADAFSYDGLLYAIILFTFIGIIVVLTVLFLIIKIWGSPISTAAQASLSGRAIVQHLENSKIGSLKLAKIGGGAIRHQKIEDGTLITIPKGINNLDGHPFVNSWNLTGISVPTFLIGAITKLRQFGYSTKDHLESAINLNESMREPLLKEWQNAIATKNDDDQISIEKKLADIPDIRHTNLIRESYNFNDFNDVLRKAQSPKCIPLDIEHVNDFIPSVNQHYTESKIAKGVNAYLITHPDNFFHVIIFTGIGVFIAGLGIYFMGAWIK